MMIHQPENTLAASCGDIGMIPPYNAHRSNDVTTWGHDQIRPGLCLHLRNRKHTKPSTYPSRRFAHCFRNALDSLQNWPNLIDFQYVVRYCSTYVYIYIYMLFQWILGKFPHVYIYIYIHRHCIVMYYVIYKKKYIYIYK